MIGGNHALRFQALWRNQVYTLFILALFLVDFFSHGARPVERNLVVVYLALLSAYSVDKEVARWASRKDKNQVLPERKGSWYVVFWALFYAGVSVASFLDPSWKVPEGLAARRHHGHRRVLRHRHLQALLRHARA